MRITKKKNNKKIVTFSLIVLLLAVIGFFAYKISTRVISHNGSMSDESSKPLKINDVNYDDPTDEEIAHSQDAKKNNSHQSVSSSKSADTKKDVGVAISYADINSGKLEIRAFATGVIEGSGTCSARVTKSDTTLSATSPAFIDASTTICEPIYLNKTRLTPGTWSVVVTFSSPDATGISNPVTVEVQ